MLLAAGCSLDGLAEGGSAGGGGAAAATSTSVSAGGAGDGGGTGGSVESAFDWLRSVGNVGSQGTSPYPTDAGNGSSLRMSAPDANGAVWICAVTEGAIDPDGPGGYDAAGNATSRNLFLLELGEDGALLSFHAYAGDLVDVDDSLSVGAIERLDAGAIAVVGTFRGGTLDFGAAGMMTQSSQTQDDAFVVRFDADGVATIARQLGGANAQTARAAVYDGNRMLVAGKLKRTMKVTDPVTTLEDDGCAYSVGTEDFERATMLVFDPETLACKHLATLAGVDTSATQQAYGVWTDASGVYVVGGFTKQILAAPLAAVPAAAGEDGFVAAFENNLANPTPRWVARATSNRNSATDSLRAVYADGARVFVGGFLERGTSMVGGMDPALGVIGGSPCAVATPVGRDGIVGVLDVTTGACLGTLLLGGVDEDEVHAITPTPLGIAASGFTTNGIAGLDASLRGGSRDGFVALLDPALTISGGRVLGGTSWDYLDGAWVDGAKLRVAGSYDTRFDFLDGQSDFFIGSLDAN